MSILRSRQIVLVWVAIAVGAGSLLVPGSALAAKALFRIEQRWHNFPNPPVTTPGGAGQYQGYVYPYYLDTPAGGYNSPPATAEVLSGNPIGGKFTLPQSFLMPSYTGTLLAKTAWPGYTTTYFYIAYNGPGKFEPSFNAPLKNGRLFFPTTGMNPEPNLGLGQPLTPTTTFDGQFDGGGLGDARGGSLKVTQGENRFGGTFRLFYPPEAGWEQYIFKFPPYLYEGFGYYHCLDDGMYTQTDPPHCTPNAHTSEPGTTGIYKGVWWRLTGTYPNAPCHPVDGCYKAKYDPGQGNYPTPAGEYSYKRLVQHYLNLIHPFTTGMATAVNPVPQQGTGLITPMATGYDISLGGADINVTHFDWNLNFKYTPQGAYYTEVTTETYPQYLKGVTRVVSMVRPRLTWTYQVPLEEGEAIENIWSPVRMWRIKVFFLPEPGGMLMLGVGIAALAGLSLLRKR